MAEFILKDWYGKDQVFDKETIYVQGADGELMPFTHGEGNPVIEPLNVTQNGVYTTPVGVNGFSPVSVNVPAPEIKLQEKTITENGEYTADAGFDGLGKVTVEVAGSGGGSLPAGVYWQQIEPYAPYNFSNYFFTFQGNLCVISKTASSADTYVVYRHDGDVWTAISGTITLLYAPNWVIERNGKLHIFCGTSHYIYGGSTTTRKENTPGSDSYCERNGDLFAYKYGSVSLLYRWDEGTDTWTDSGLVKQTSYTDGELFFHNDELYRYDFNSLYKCVDGAWIQKKSFTKNNTNCVLYVAGKVYLAPSGSVSNVYSYDIDNDVFADLGIGAYVGSGGYLYEYNKTARMAGGSNTQRCNYIMHIIEATK